MVKALHHGTGELAAWTSKVQIHVGAPSACARLVRRRYTFRGFQYFDSNGNANFADDHAKFAAHASSFDETHTAEAVANSLGPGTETSVAERVLDYLGRPRGELLYEFEVWKDTVAESSRRLLQILDQALKEEFGTDWRSCNFSPSLLFVHVHTKLGGSCNYKFDLTSCLLQGKTLRFDEVFLARAALIWDGVEDPGDNASRVDSTIFPEDFTAELESAHRRCEPDAFGCRRGGKGAPVEIVGLQKRSELNGQLGYVLGPVDLAEGRWPVKMYASGEAVKVRRCNLRPAEVDGASEDEHVTHASCSCRSGSCAIDDPTA
eukprot:gb/GFBE01058230.1/.p1 GENE.gb/GFBE01058230.1/~~gb/GFBE01058230.1/.p1  ORF type:complete len:319 (+),score=45.96 gb/GFBE01058230.1/:1-957(+)